MYHWPILSAAIGAYIRVLDKPNCFISESFLLYLRLFIYVSGITSNLFFIAVVCMISWYQLIHSEEYRRYIESQERESKLEYFKGDLDGGKYF